MQVIKETISIDELKSLSDKNFRQLVNAVVDVENGFITIDSEMHADQEAFLIEQGSKQGNLWGINIYPYATEEDWIEFISLINFRPSWGNRSRSIEDPAIKAQVTKIVTRLVKSTTDKKES